MSDGVTGPVSSALRRASLICPQPVAIACGRVMRACSFPERLDACLRSGEVLARYISAVALSSFAARGGGDALNISALDGNLSFGHFLSAAQQVSNIEVPHPAEAYLSAGANWAARASPRTIRTLRPASPVLDFPVSSMASGGKEKPARRGLSRSDDRAHRALTQLSQLAL
jgi:hypothetical protein